MQESVLLKFKPLLIFLKENSQDTYVEMTNYYAEIMDKIYYHLLKTYISETAKLVEERVTKHDLIIIDEKDKQKNNATGMDLSMSYASSHKPDGAIATQPNLNDSIVSAGGRQQPTAPIVPFDLEDRLSILERIDSNPLVSHISQSK